MPFDGKKKSADGGIGGIIYFKPDGRRGALRDRRCAGRKQPVYFPDQRLEAALALRKNDPGRWPNLNCDDAASWFRRARRTTGARLIPIGVNIALEAARVPAAYGIGDPGDCYISATARVKGLTELHATHR